MSQVVKPVVSMPGRGSLEKRAVACAFCRGRFKDDEPWRVVVTEDWKHRAMHVGCSEAVMQRKGLVVSNRGDVGVLA